MKTYIVNIEYRKGAGKILGPFSTFENAQREMLNYLGMTLEEIAEYEKEYEEFDSCFDKGTFYSEEESVEILERELE